MGFSKSNLPVRFAALALVGAFAASLGVVTLPSEAEAARKRHVWSVKFKCSAIDTNQVRLDDTLFVTGDFFIQTIVNIHNPSDISVDFKRKFVIMSTVNVGATSKASAQGSAITLNANLGFALDCEDIRTGLLTIGGIGVLDAFAYVDKVDATSNLIEGWVVIESERGKKNSPALVVCANYILAAKGADAAPGASDPTGLSLNTECIDPIRVKFSGSF